MRSLRCPSCPRPSVLPSFRPPLCCVRFCLLLFCCLFSLMGWRTHLSAQEEEERARLLEGMFIGGHVYLRACLLGGMFIGRCCLQVPGAPRSLWQQPPSPPGGPSHWPPPGGSFPAFPTSLPDWSWAVFQARPPDRRTDAGAEKRGLSLPRPVEPRPTNLRVFLENWVGI